MRLNREQIKQFHAALKSAFPNRLSLEMLLRLELDAELGDIAGNENHSETVFRVITWAETYGRVEELVRQAHQANGGNPALCAFVAAYFSPPVVSSVEKPEVPQNRVEARSAATEVPVVSPSPVEPVVATSPDVRLAVNPKDVAELVWIPAGDFLMGNEKRKITLPEYAIYKTPVTVAMYCKFDAATGKKFDWDGRQPNWGWQNDHPMMCVTWQEANAYCEWAGVSLPTEAEWEKAARGMDGREYPWEGHWDASKCNNYTTGPGRTTPVGNYPQGASPYDVLDMVGNVWEWCIDEVKKKFCALRGGSWSNNAPDTFRCARRNEYNPGVSVLVGFRCVSHLDSH